MFDCFPLLCDACQNLTPTNPRGYKCPPFLRSGNLGTGGRAGCGGPGGHIFPPCPTVPEQSRGTTPTTPSHGILSPPFKGTQSLEERVPAYTPIIPSAEDALPPPGDSGCRFLGSLGLTSLCVPLPRTHRVPGHDGGRVRVGRAGRPAGPKAVPPHLPLRQQRLRLLFLLRPGLRHLPLLPPALRRGVRGAQLRRDPQSRG